MCQKLFLPNKYGFLDFTDENEISDIDSTTENYAEEQKTCNDIVYDQYLKQFLAKETTKRVLDVGCGIGKSVQRMIKDDYKAYGIDLPNLSKFWDKENIDPKKFFCCDAGKMPFPNDFFDVVYSFGVIEHIGTELGHYTLSKNYKKFRQEYANEILRVTKPNGRILISCPNKRFPIDLLHEPLDSLSRKTRINEFRRNIFDILGLNIHPISGDYHLLSYLEIDELFISNGTAKTSQPLSLKNYFSYCSLQNGYSKLIFKKIITTYLNNIPKFLRRSFLNPYVLVEIRN